jgi:hypothetical protein
MVAARITACIVPDHDEFEEMPIINPRLYVRFTYLGRVLCRYPDSQGVQGDFWGDSFEISAKPTHVSFFNRCQVLSSGICNVSQVQARQFGNLYRT